MPTLEFQVVHKDKNKYATKSPVMAADSFNFCVSVRIICRVAVHLEGKHNSEDIYLGAYMHFTEKQGVSDDFPLGTPMKLEIELVNHDNLQKSIVFVRRRTRLVYPGLGQGWRKFLKKSELTKEKGWLDSQGKLVFRASASIVEVDPTPLKPAWHEVRFDGRQEYDPGDEFKPPPTWKGNYKFQVAIFPGGIRSEDGQQCLAAYIHLLGTREINTIDFVKVKVKLLNHKDAQKTITWTAVHTFDELGHSWGCPALVPIHEIKQEKFGWLNPSGEIVLRASVLPALVGGPNPVEVQSRGRHSARRSSTTGGFPGIGLKESPEASPKRVKLE
ncbi:hypothetical protein FOZ60_006362 [Perkinsus olseni]|uniref:MATH domain-containing protein n=1 Tax=Perkinsus olseni TaxID=32597 RepID=A0A7J6NQ11_PEROL|nr:hypothetical protein FOZ60_006362 [Perkinsus olseni]